METEEHLNKIVVKCRELLAGAEMRTEGKWLNDTSVTTCKGEIVPHTIAKVLYPFAAR